MTIKTILSGSSTGLAALIRLDAAANTLRERPQTPEKTTPLSAGVPPQSKRRIFTRRHGS